MVITVSASTPCHAQIRSFVLSVTSGVQWRGEWKNHQSKVPCRTSRGELKANASCVSIRLPKREGKMVHLEFWPPRRLSATLRHAHRQRNPHSGPEIAASGQWERMTNFANCYRIPSFP